MQIDIEGRLYSRGEFRGSMHGLNNLDLNLLKVFDAIQQERSVSIAADRLNMTQPAVSNALNRLRQTLGDQLFVRTRNGMEPTPWPR